MKKCDSNRSERSPNFSEFHEQMGTCSTTKFVFLKILHSDFLSEMDNIWTPGRPFKASKCLRSSQLLEPLLDTVTTRAQLQLASHGLHVGAPYAM